MPTGLQSISYANHWGLWGPNAILESYSGAWQQNVVVAPTSTLLSFSPVWCCVTGIATDVSKIRLMLARIEEGNIWTEITENSPWLSVLAQPNNYQDQIKFLEAWVLSKLLYGNTYVLKRRKDLRGLVTEMHVLHPRMVTTLVAPNGDVYYEIDRDDLSGTPDLVGVPNRPKLTLPASEIIHDRFNTLWHHLVGVSPLYACGNSATLGNSIQTGATKFFANRSMPGGMLSAPGAISDETAARLKTAFEAGFGGDNLGRTFVAGDDLKFVPFSIDAEKSKQVEQLEAAGFDAARAFHYPAWKLAGTQPPYTKPDEAQVMYYTDCLQKHMTDIESCLKYGLELPAGQGITFDLDELMRMDTNALYESNNKASGWMTPDEQRNRANFKPLPKGGKTVYKQHQDYPIEKVFDRTDLNAPATTPPPQPPQEMPEMPEPESDRQENPFVMRNELVARIAQRLSA